MRQFLDFLTLILTHKCQEECFFCFIEKEDFSLNKQAATKAVQLFLESEGDEKTIKFFGGDPLLEFELLKEIVLFAEEKIKTLGKRVDFILPTPGTLLNKQMMSFIKLHQIELILNSAQISKIKKAVIKEALALPFLTLTINVSPYTTDGLAAEFKRFIKMEFSRFNLLPLYYIRWPAKSIKELERQFNKIKVFYQRYPQIYFKNFELKGDVPLFNTCLTCDVTGELFSSNAVLFKSMANFRKNLLLGNVSNMDNRAPLIAENIPLSSTIQKAFSKEVLRDTFKVDRVLGSFLSSLYRKIKRADIKMGNSCNNSCKFCVRRKKGSCAPEKTKVEIMKNLREARRECQGVVFSGGEPSIRNDLLALVSYARRLGYERIQIQTNGRMFSYKEFCHKAVEAGANEFEVAIHGHIPQLHDYLTSCEGSFYQTVRAIRNMKELDMPVFTNTVITKSNYRNLEQIAHLLIELGVNQFQFAFVHALGQAAENFDSVVPRMSLVMSYLKKGLDAGISAKVRVMTEAVPYCLLGKYKDYAAENIIPSTKIFELFGRVIDFDKIRLNLAKAKGPDCKRCRFFSACEGIWREYPHKFGWEEFKPVLKG